MIGDTTYDMEMARMAGVGALGVAWGYHPVEALVAAGAHDISEAAETLVGQAERLRAFLRAGLAVALVNAAVLGLFGLLAPEQDLVRVTINALLGIVDDARAGKDCRDALAALRAPATAFTGRRRNTAASSPGFRSN